MQLEQVSKRFANGRGVRDVSFEVRQGDIFGLIGPNGAGKTTLLKIITGLIRPDQGDVRLFGHRLTERFEQAMEQVGCIIETADFYEYLTAWDHLRMAARFYPQLPKSRIDEVLELVGLTAYKKEQAGIYSLGMKQRLALASALLSHPRLVILDEPTNGLDIEGMVEIRDLIGRLAREQGTTFLISSHMIHDLGLIANRVGILHNGLLIQDGYVDQLLQGKMTLEQYVVSQIQTAKEAGNYA
ncbi:MAG: transporter [Paenibacillaceae bacterium]|nr:transporter [Paenibacillaceae bacterium]